MRRREFVAGLGAATLLHAVRAHQAALPVVGMIGLRNTNANQCDRVIARREGVMGLKSWARTNPVLRAPYQIVGDAYWRMHWTLLRLTRKDIPSLELADIDRTVAFSLNFLRDVDGDIAEFGVKTGKYAKFECKWLSRLGQKRDVHLFDSWQGYGQPKGPDFESLEYLRGIWRPGSVGQISPEDLTRSLEKLYRGGRIVVHPGFFGATLSTIKPDVRFALICVDPGLFSAADEVLTYLFAHKHIAEGAVILFNSYNASRASPLHSVRAAWAKAVEEFHVRYSDEGAFQWSGRKFIVQSYTSASGCDLADAHEALGDAAE
jgi:hypothetical protein